MRRLVLGWLVRRVVFGAICWRSCVCVYVTARTPCACLCCIITTNDLSVLHILATTTAASRGRIPASCGSVSAAVALVVLSAVVLPLIPAARRAVV